MSVREMQDGEETLACAAEWVVRLNEASATEEDFIAWQAWLAADPAHAQAFHEIHDAWRRSAVVSRVSVSQLQTLEPGEAKARSSSAPRPRRAVWALAAALVLSIGTGILVWQQRGETIETQTAELRSIRLPDGSRTALGPETEVSFDYSDRGRAVIMSGGEAYFEVANDPHRPFSVETRAGRITALGTAFSVNLSGKRMAVTVTQGSVKVEPAEDAAAAKAPIAPLVVGAGHKLVSENGRVLARVLPPSANALAWRDGRLQYEGEPLRVVVADINRYSPIELRIADPAAGELRYTGTVFPDSLDVWLSSIEGVFPLRVVRENDERIIASANR